VYTRSACERRRLASAGAPHWSRLAVHVDSMDVCAWRYCGLGGLVRLQTSRRALLRDCRCRCRRQLEPRSIWQTRGVADAAVDASLSGVLERWRGFM